MALIVGGHMRVTFLGLAAVIIIGAILVFAGPRLISADTVRDKLRAQVESSTGYRLRVSGLLRSTLRLTLLPRMWRLPRATPPTVSKEWALTLQLINGDRTFLLIA